MSKYILCDAATADYGKSTTLNHLLALFQSMPNLYKVTPLQKYNTEGDNVCLIECLHIGKTILIQTGGDNSYAFQLTLNHLEKNTTMLPDVIVCASRTKGGSAEEAEYIRRTYNYHYIDFRNLCAWEKSDIDFVKQLNLQFLVTAMYEIILHLL